MHFSSRSSAAAGSFLPASLGTALFVIWAVQLQRRGKLAAENAYPEREKQRNDRIFGIINADLHGRLPSLSSLAAFWLTVCDLSRIRSYPRIAFLPMPPLYRHRDNFFTGAFMVVWAALCVALFKEDGNRMAAFVALGAGGALWCSAAWALKTARGLLQHAIS